MHSPVTQRLQTKQFVLQDTLPQGGGILGLELGPFAGRLLEARSDASIERRLGRIARRARARRRPAALHTLRKTHPSLWPLQ